jgi:hypothetical protein
MDLFRGCLSIGLFLECKLTGTVLIVAPEAEAES